MLTKGTVKGRGVLAAATLEEPAEKKPHSALSSLWSFVLPFMMPSSVLVGGTSDGGVVKGASLSLSLSLSSSF